MNELKPCPFCGESARIVPCDDEGNLRSDEYDKNPWSGLCYRIVHVSFDCPVSSDGGMFLYDTKDDAVESWNRRADEFDREELLKVAEEINADAENIAGYLDSCEGSFSKNDADKYYKLAGWVNRIRRALGVEE